VIDRVEITGALIGLLLLVVVLELVRRRKLTEEYSLLWIVAAIALVTLAFSRPLLHMAASWLGIFYPPAILLLALVVLVFAALLYFSVVVSRQKQQIERLVEEVGILAAEVRDLRKSHATAEGARV
jgi:hypothetical protein